MPLSSCNLHFNCNFNGYYNDDGPYAWIPVEKKPTKGKTWTKKEKKREKKVEKKDNFKAVP